MLQKAKHLKLDTRPNIGTLSKLGREVAVRKYSAMQVGTEDRQKPRCMDLMNAWQYQASTKPTNEPRATGHGKLETSHNEI